MSSEWQTGGSTTDGAAERSTSTMTSGKSKSGRYVSGAMVFVMDYDKLRGYVVIAGRPDWRVVYLDCKS
jgi:hypothetical protein